MASESPVKRILRISNAIRRRLLHQLALFRAKSLSLARARSIRPRKLLGMCYGNIYRSPFVAAWLAAHLPGHDGYEIRSAGFHQKVDRPSDPDYVQMVRAEKIDLAPHRSRLVTPDDLEWAEAIIIMDRYNWERLRPFGADIEAKVLWLGAFNGGTPIEVEDPYGLSSERAKAIVHQMSAAADGLVSKLLEPGEATGA